MRYQRVADACACTWLEYTRLLWGTHWAICRATPQNLQRYDRCVTQKEYRQAEADYRAMTGREPYTDEPTPERIAAVLGALIESYADTRDAVYGPDHVQSPALSRGRALLADLQKVRVPKMVAPSPDAMAAAAQRAAPDGDDGAAVYHLGDKPSFGRRHSDAPALRTGETAGGRVQ